MWPFDRSSHSPLENLSAQQILTLLNQKLDLILYQQGLIMRSLHLKPQPIQPGSPSSPPLPRKLGAEAVHRVSREDLIRREKERELNRLRAEAGLSEPLSPTASPEDGSSLRSTSPPLVEEALTPSSIPQPTLEIAPAVTKGGDPSPSTPR